MLQQKMIRTRKSLANAGLVLVVATSAAWGQCEPEWSEVFTPRFMAGGHQASATIFDDGTGPRLVVSDLERFGEDQHGLQVWDGQAWSTLLLPTEAVGDRQIVRSLNGNLPPRLVLTDEEVNRLQDVYILENGEWQSTSFPVVSHFSPAVCIEPGPNPASEEFYIGGLFIRGGGLPNTLVYRWDGSEWTPLDETSSGASVADLVWFDDGTGMALYASVRSEIDGVAAAGVARWDGESWEEVGGGCPAFWPSLEVHDDGSGLALWALDTLGELLAKWDGTAWTAFPLQQDNAFFDWRLTSHTIAGQEELFWLGELNDESHLWRWDGQEGELVTTLSAGEASDMAVDPTGTLGEGLFAVGDFLQAG